jgi:nucleoside-diphosphate-sugar epimerase
VREGDAETYLERCSPYAAAKFAASAYGRMFHALYHTPVTILRLFMVYGPGQQDLRKLVPYVTLALLKGEMPRVSSGVREVDRIYVDDVAAGYLAAATATGVEGEHH